MRINKKSIAIGAVLFGAAMACSVQAQADVLNLNYSAVSPDGVTINNSIVNAAINTPAALSSSTYSHTLPALNFSIPGSVSSGNPTGSEFYDDYIFTIGGSSLASITATIDLGNVFNIDNLNVRLFSWDGTAEQLSNTVTIGSTTPSPIQAWTYATGTGDVAVIDQTGLAAGTYVLQVRGNVSGTAGGTYVGSLNVAPVPLPAALPLLVSGFGLLGGLIRRRSVA